MALALPALTHAHATAAVAGTVTEIVETTVTETEIVTGIAATKTRSADDQDREIVIDASTHIHTRL